MRNKPGKESVESAVGSTVAASGQPPVGGAPGAPEQTGEIPLVSQNDVVATACNANNSDADVPEPQRYRVKQTRRIMCKGGLVFLREGKVIDARTYDLDNLIAQGVQLEEA